MAIRLKLVPTHKKCPGKLHPQLLWRVSQGTASSSVLRLFHADLDGSRLEHSGTGLIVRTVILETERQHRSQRHLVSTDAKVLYLFSGLEVRPGYCGEDPWAYVNE